MALDAVFNARVLSSPPPWKIDTVHGQYAVVANDGEVIAEVATEDIAKEIIALGGARRLTLENERRATLFESRTTGSNSTTIEGTNALFEGE